MTLQAQSWIFLMFSSCLSLVKKRKTPRVTANGYMIPLRGNKNVLKLNSCNCCTVLGMYTLGDEFYATALSIKICKKIY